MSKSQSEGKGIKCKHKEGPVGYIQKMRWLETMSKKYDQLKCPVCGLFKVWKRKTKVINQKDIYLELCERCGGNHKTKDCVKSYH